MAVFDVLKTTCILTAATIFFRNPSVLQAHHHFFFFFFFFFFFLFFFFFFFQFFLIILFKKQHHLVMPTLFCTNKFYSPKIMPLLRNFTPQSFAHYFIVTVIIMTTSTAHSQHITRMIIIMYGITTVKGNNPRVISPVCRRSFRRYHST